MNTIINILSKNPDFSDCKTRLKGLLTLDERMFLSKKMLEMTCSEISKIDADRRLSLSPNVDGDFINNLSKKYMIELDYQDDGFLSEKILATLKSTYHYKKLLIGSDIPSLTHTELHESIKLLDSYDIVFGPSKDGGFYLVGVKGKSYSIFNDLKLNTITLNHLVITCKKYNLSYKLIRKLKDIDDSNDLLFI